jgi:hypothetical protein
MQGTTLPKSTKHLLDRREAQRQPAGAGEASCVVQDRK